MSTWGQPYLVLEYVDGEPIDRYCERARLDLAARVRLFLDVASAVEHAHAQLIVHRDLKPSNVLVAAGGDVKLLDFGIAQALMKFTSEIGVLKGKFSYMSPEQIRGMPLDARTDVFSTGIILHEMLTTEKLFRGDTEFALMEKVRKAEVPPPSNFNRRVTPELDRVVFKALARDVADRYQSAAELARELDGLIEGYRFDPKELRQFMRQMFRKEYAKELEETQHALSGIPELAPSRTGAIPVVNPVVTGWGMK
jgi:serine/threonine protein kinase